MSVRRVVTVSAWLLVAAGLWLLVPTQWGGHLGLTVVSGQSMEPTHESDDLLLTWRHDSYRPGDVVVYRVPAGGPGAGLHVVHRVVRAHSDGSYTLLGDNNEHPDLWQPTGRDVQGEVFAAVPGGGRWWRLLVSPLALALLCGVLVGLAVGLDGGRRVGPTGDDKPGRRHRGKGRAATAAGTAAVTMAAMFGSSASAASLGGVASAQLLVDARPVGITGSVTYEQTMTSNLLMTYCASVLVTNGTNTTTTWQITVDLSQAPFDANVVTSVTGAVGVTMFADSWTVRGGPTNHTLAPGASTTFSYCGAR